MPPDSATTSTFDSVAPTTGEVVATHPLHGQADVGAAVERARQASGWWSTAGFDGRRHLLRRWKAELARGCEELAGLVHRENGKPTDDALLEVVVTIDHLAWAASHAKRVLGLRRVRSSPLALDVAAHVEHQPFGVVGVVGPWNYPVLTPMGSIAYALAAGNTVVFKPSEHTPGVGLWLAEAMRRAIGRRGVLEVVTGDGSTGAALVRAGVDKVAFTGSATTGRRVLAACAETLTPVLMECGGNDAMLVAADADLDAAADAAVWGAMSNAGQTCIGIERAYVVAEVHDAFVEKVRGRASRLRPGRDYGPMTMPAQGDVVDAHVRGAIDAGAHAVVGSRDSVRPPYAEPVVLVDVPDDQPISRDETFGPTLVVHRVADLDEALTRANDSAYGLGSSVWTSSRSRGMDLARRLRSGMTAVNGVLSFAAVPSLPFGGVGESGFGRIHGDDGLREFTRAKAISRARLRLPASLYSFDRPPGVTRRVVSLVRLLHGRA